MGMNWKVLYFGKVSKDEVLEYVRNEEWQAVRRSMLGTSLLVKYNTLLAWLVIKNYSYASKVQVTNYVTALSRGGLIKPSDYK